MKEAVVVSVVRTAVGKAPKGTLRYTRPDDLGAVAVKGAVDRVPALDPKEIEDVIIGCAMPEGEQGMNMARLISLRAGLPIEAAAMTVNRYCASGLQTIALAAERIRGGGAEVIVAGGAESMSYLPMGGNKIAVNPWLVDNHPDLFDGVTEAIGEVGGFSATIGGRRIYAIQTAEKGMAWMRLTARGTAGHGSMLQPDNAVTEIAETVARIGRHEWPVRLTPSVTAFLAAAADALGIEFTPDAADEVLAKLGPIARMVGATLTSTVNPTALKAGYKVNVVPQSATADVDGRFLPGHEEEFFAEVDELLGAGVKREFIHHDIALETTFDGDLCAAMTGALLAEDPDARIAAYCLSGGTDAKSFSRLGIRCFGFTPLRLPADLDFAGMFHGVDERVPVESLRFGVRVLDEFLDRC